MKTSCQIMMAALFLWGAMINTSNAQVAINVDGSSADASAMLDVKSYSAGILIPRMSSFNRTAISNPANGLMVYDSTTKSFWHFDGTNWIEIVSQSNTIDLNDLFDASTNNTSVYLGDGSTRDYSYNRFNTALGKQTLPNNWPGEYNTAIGYNALSDNSYTDYNTAVGSHALQYNQDYSNTAIGSYSLSNHKSGSGNVAMGSSTLYWDTVGSYNTAIGWSSMYNNSSGSNNIAIGAKALSTNTTKSFLVAIGDSALFNNGAGAAEYEAVANTAVGSKTLYANTTGSDNTAIGFLSLQLNIDGLSNTAIGSYSLNSNTSGHSNTACGVNALSSNETGDYNTVVGSTAFWLSGSGEKTTAIGYAAGGLATGNSNVFIGHLAGYGATGDNKLYIDNDNNTTPLIFGDFSTQRVGFGSTNPDAKVDIRSSGTTEDPLRIRVGSASKLRVHAANGSVSVGTSVQGPDNGMISQGNIEPRSHKGADLGANGIAWDNIYYDDLYNQGASAFEGRTTCKEILDHPPKGKKPGSFDYKTERGDVELDPASMPEGLADKNSLLTDEISSYNYKTNYEQQLLIEKLLKENNELTSLIKKLEERVVKLEGD